MSKYQNCDTRILNCANCKMSSQSVSAYLAELVKRDVNAGWPEGFEAALFGPQVECLSLAIESAGLAQERIALQ